MLLPRPGFAEMDAEQDWWGSVADVCKQLSASVAFQPIHSGEALLGGMCVSGLGPALVVTGEDESGVEKPLHQAVLYGIDARAEKEIEEQTKQLGHKAIVKRCGKGLSSQAIGPKLAWVRKHVHGVEPNANWYSSHSYVVRKLTGNWALDHHTASQCDPLYDVLKQEWAEDWAEAVLPGIVLPKLFWPGDTVGELLPDAAASLDLPAGIPVLMGTIDAWAEAYSVGASSPGDLMLMYGSTMFMIQVLETPAISDKLWTTSGIVPGSHTLAAGMATSGSITVWLQELCGGVDFSQLVAEAEALPPGSDGLLLLPYFAGERTPIYDPGARGTICGLTLRHKRGHIFRAVYEGIAYGIRQIVEQLEECSGDATRVIAVGGGTKGNLWTQIVSDVCGIEQIIPEVAIGAAYGDALLVAQSQNIYPRDENWLRIRNIIKPNLENSDRYNDLYKAYCELYPATVDLMHELAVIQESD